MRLHKTDGIKIEVKVENVTTALSTKTKRFTVVINGETQVLDLPETITKSQIKDASFVQSLLNFFIKE